MNIADVTSGTEKRKVNKEQAKSKEQGMNFRVMQVPMIKEEVSVSDALQAFPHTSKINGTTKQNDLQSGANVFLTKEENILNTALQHNVQNNTIHNKSALDVDCLRPKDTVVILVPHRNNIAATNKLEVTENSEEFMHIYIGILWANLS